MKLHCTWSVMHLLLLGCISQKEKHRSERLKKYGFFDSVCTIHQGNAHIAEGTFLQSHFIGQLADSKQTPIHV